jgi:stress-induced morphogen
MVQKNPLATNSYHQKQQDTLQYETLFQVIMVKSLFDDKSRVHRFWKSGITS